MFLYYAEARNSKKLCIEIWGNVERVACGHDDIDMKTHMLKLPCQSVLLPLPVLLFLSFFLYHTFNFCPFSLTRKFISVLLPLPDLSFLSFFLYQTIHFCPSFTRPFIFVLLPLTDLSFLFFFLYQTIHFVLLPLPDL